jgi:hypothetical protein
LIDAKSDFGSPTATTIGYLIASLEPYRTANDEELRGFLSAYFSNLVIIKVVLAVGQEISNLDVVLASANREFYQLTGYQLNVFDVDSYQINVEAVKLAVNNIFETYVKGGELIDQQKQTDSSEMTNVDLLVQKLVALSSLFGATTKKIVNLANDYLNVVRDILFQTGELDVPKGVQSSIDKIEPLTPVPYKDFNRFFAQRIYDKSESVFQHQKVIVPIVQCISKIPDDSPLVRIRKNFVDRFVSYVAMVSAVAANPEGRFMNAPVYGKVVIQAVKRIEELFAKEMPNWAQQGGQSLLKRMRGEYGSDDDEDESDGLVRTIEQMPEESKVYPSGIAVESPPVEREVKRQRMASMPDMWEVEPANVKTSRFDMYELAGNVSGMVSSGVTIDTLKSNNLSFVVLMEFDGLIKNIYNVLTYYFISIQEHERDDPLAEYKLRELYEMIGNKYLRLPELESMYDGSGDDMETEVSADVTENMYLFNALESQVKAGSVRVYETENVAWLFYLLLNQEGSDGPILFPEYNERIERLKGDLPTLIETLTQIDYEYLGQLMASVDETIDNEMKTISRDSYIDSMPEPGRDRPDQGQLPQLVTVYGGKKLRMKRRRTRAKKVKKGKGRQTRNKKFKKVRKTKKVNRRIMRGKWSRKMNGRRR